MSPVAINGVDKQGVDVNGVQVKQTLDAANSTVNKGVYDATLLETVDPDLAVGNIKLATEIFGKLGTLAAGTATHDIEGNALSAKAGYSDTGDLLYYLSQSVASDADFDTASLTQTYSAGCVAEAFGYMQAGAGAANYFKVRLYMDGVQKAESGYLPASYSPQMTVVNGYSALSGEKIVKTSAHNYDAGSQNLRLLAIGAICISGVFAGSVKVV